MSHASYMRGSAAISESIRCDFNENGGNSRLLREQMTRDEKSISELETFCRSAQSLYVDATDESTAKGLVLGNLHSVWLKKIKTKKFNSMLEECALSHCAWVDSDIQLSFEHLAVCRRKAAAWIAVLNQLNPAPSVVLPFNIPSL